jgi:protein-tyrosine phosphatase
VLALVGHSASRGRPVFVHCLRGKDRTGTVVAVYRIARDGWTNRQALDEARKLGLSRWARSMSRYILRYTPAATAAAAAAP